MIRTVAKLVAFFAVCAMFTAYLAFTIGNIHIFQHTYKLTATFDDATGLLPTDNVKVAGVVVGQVKGVHIDQGRAKVTFSVRTSVKLPTDSSAAIRWRNLLGQRYVYLYPGSSSTVLRGGDRITKTRSVVDVGELFNRLGPIVQAIDPKEVNTFLDTIVAALDGNQDKLRQSIDDLAVVASSLGSRDAAIGRLIGNLNTVTGAIDERDAQIRTVLDNLVLISQTFSQNTGVLSTAVDELGDFSKNFGGLLADNRTQVDNIIGNLNTILDEVKLKLPVLDTTLAGLDEATKRLFTSSRYGEWLNQVIPCGSVAGVVNSNTPCITGAGSLTNTLGQSQAQASDQGPPPAPTRGSDALTQLFTGGAGQ